MTISKLIAKWKIKAKGSFYVPADAGVLAKEILADLYLIKDEYEVPEDRRKEDRRCAEERPRYFTEASIDTGYNIFSIDRKQTGRNFIANFNTEAASKTCCYALNVEAERRRIERRQP